MRSSSLPRRNSQLVITMNSSAVTSACRQTSSGVISRGLSRPRARRGSQNFDRGLRAIAASHATAR